MRSFIFFVLFFPFTFIMGCLSILFIVITFKPRTGFYFAKFWSKGLIKMAGIKLSIENIENIPHNKSVIFIANHQSYFDIPILYATIPKEFRILAKKSLFFIPIFGWHLYLSGNVPIERKNPIRASKGIRDAEEILNNNISILLFPEGTRSRDGELQSFKKGAFFLSKKVGKEIIPVVIRGTSQVLKKGSLKVKKAPVSITFLSSIYQQEINSLTLEELSSKVWQRINQCLQGGLIE